MKRKIQSITQTTTKRITKSIAIAILLISIALLTSCAIIEDVINLQAGMTRASEYEQRYDVASDVFIIFDETLFSEPLPDNLHFELRNNSERSYIYGDGATGTLEVKIQGIWRAVTPYLGYAVSEVGFGLDPFTRVESSFPLFFYHNNLRPGQYRLVKRIIHWDEPLVNPNIYIVFEEFTII